MARVSTETKTGIVRVSFLLGYAQGSSLLPTQGGPASLSRRLSAI